MSFPKVLLLCLSSPFYSHGANILGAFLFPSISHQIVFQPIWRELSLRGHNVTVITPNPLNDPSLVNLTEIDVHYTYDILKKYKLDNLISKDNGNVQSFYKLAQLSSIIADESFQSIAFRQIIDDPNCKFDLILIEIFFPVLHALSARFNAPVIAVTSLGAAVSYADAVGNPSHPILNPDFLVSHEINNIWNKISCVFYNVASRFLYRFRILPDAHDMARKYFGDDIPYIGDLERNMSMMFVTENPLIHNIRPNVPAVVQLSQMHIKAVKPLPKHLKLLLDESTEGVVYFSLGSNVKSAQISKRLKNIIIGALTELPYKVLWKWEDDFMAGKPKNVFLSKWFPQQDVLAHPNVKVFVSQGGLQSTEEAISRGVPLVGMPFIADQPQNVRQLVKLGAGKGVDPLTVTKTELKQAIIEVAENTKYRRKVREIRMILQDQPMTGLEKAVWWCEYVIRHDGAKHLKSPAVDLPLYEYYLIDVISFVISLFLLPLLITYFSRKLTLK